MITSCTFNLDGSWTDPLGKTWYARHHVDPVRKAERLKKHPEDVGPGEEYEVNWPRLRNLKHEVKDYTAAVSPGLIRTLRLPRTIVGGVGTRDRDVLVHHPDDLKAAHANCPPTPKERIELRLLEKSYKAHEYQQAEEGKYKGKSFVAPRVVAKRLGVDAVTVDSYRRNGITWMPKKGQEPRFKGGRLKNKRKPITRPFPTAPDQFLNRVADFWLEDDLEVFEEALADLKANPPDGLIAGTNEPKKANGPLGSKDFGIGRNDACEKRTKGRFAAVTALVCRTLTRSDGKTVPFVVAGKFIPKEELVEYQKLRLAPSPWTIQRIAKEFGISIFRVYQLFPQKARTKEPVGQRHGRVREIYTISEAKVKRLWEKRKGTPWPFDELQRLPAANIHQVGGLPDMRFAELATLREVCQEHSSRR